MIKGGYLLDNPLFMCDKCVTNKCAKLCASSSLLLANFYNLALNLPDFPILSHLKKPSKADFAFALVFSDTGSP